MLNTQHSATHTSRQQAPEFAIQRIYVKDLSLEVPDSPSVFLEAWEPHLNLDLGTQTKLLSEGVHEVVLSITVTVKLKEKIAFLVEVKQAGIFSLTGFEQDQLRPMLGSFCPNILYPYAREAVTDASVRAGFPQLYLAPVNFDLLYQQQEKAESEKASSASQ